MLLQIDVETVFRPVALGQRGDVIDVERRVCGFDRENVAIVCGVAAIGKGAEPQLAGLVEDSMALLELDHRPAGLEGEDVGQDDFSLRLDV